MTYALHTPFDEREPIDLGRGLWRKQVLKVGDLDYKGRKIAFTRDYLRSLADSFRGGAFDQVPFVLADSSNAHTMDPERFRGEVKGVELSADGQGLDVLVETTDAGSEVLRDNPGLGVSARIVESLAHGDGRNFPRAIQHVLGTFDPRVTGMKPWEAVSLSNPSDVEVIDLTSQEGQMPDDPTYTPEQQVAFDAYMNDLAQFATPDGGRGNGAGTDDDDIPLSPEDQAALDALLAAATEDDTVSAGAGTSLSADDRQEITLARQIADQARSEAAAAQSELNVARFEREKQELVLQGIPPADVDLAMPLLLGGPGANTIDLSNGTKVDAGEIARQLLASRKGTVDLSKETVPAPGRPLGDPEAALLARWQEEYPIAGADA